MQIARENESESLIRFVPHLAVVGLVLAAVVVVSLLIGTGVPVAASGSSLNLTGPVYKANLPNRAATFFQATTSLGNGRIQLEQGGNPAALAAVYRVSGGIDVYTINPQTGQGTLAYHLLDSEIASAKASAASMKNSVLIIPASLPGQNQVAAPTATPRASRRRDAGSDGHPRREPESEGLRAAGRHLLGSDHLPGWQPGIVLVRLLTHD